MYMLDEAIKEKFGEGCKCVYIFNTIYDGIFSTGGWFFCYERVLCYAKDVPFSKAIPGL